MTKPANQNAKTPAASPAASRVRTAAANTAKGAAQTAEAGPSPPLPKSWGDIQLGSVVLVQEEDGWWAAVVTEVRDDILTLRWRDYPKLPAMVRNRKAVALLFSGD
jgi:hypothetical protein